MKRATDEICSYNAENRKNGYIQRMLCVELECLPKISAAFDYRVIDLL